MTSCIGSIIRVEFRCNGVLIWYQMVCFFVQIFFSDKMICFEQYKSSSVIFPCTGSFTTWSRAAPCDQRPSSCQRWLSSRRSWVTCRLSWATRSRATCSPSIESHSLYTVRFLFCCYFLNKSLLRNLVICYLVFLYFNFSLGLRLLVIQYKCKKKKQKHKLALQKNS